MKSLWRLLPLLFLPACAGTIYLNGTEGVKEFVRYGTVGEATLVIRGNIPGVKVQADVKDATVIRDGEDKIVVRVPYAGLLACGDRIEAGIVITAPGLRVRGEPVHGVVQTWTISGRCGFGGGSSRRSAAWLLELEGNRLVLRGSGRW